MRLPTLRPDHPDLEAEVRKVPRRSLSIAMALTAALRASAAFAISDCVTFSHALDGRATRIICASRGHRAVGLVNLRFQHRPHGRVSTQITGKPASAEH